MLRDDRPEANQSMATVLWQSILRWRSYIMATKKNFNCVDMKHKGAEKVQAKLAGMSREQQLEYWRTRTDKLLELQRRALRDRKAS